MSKSRSRLSKNLRKWYRRFINPVVRTILYPPIGLMYGLMMRLWTMTLRLEYLTEDGKRPDSAWLENGPLVFAFWHGRQFGLFRVLVPRRAVVLTSLSEAGELQKWVLRSFRYRTVRGSSTRGGAAGLVAMIKEVKKGKRNSAFAVDGPRGPLHEAKPGVIQVASRGKAQLVPVTIAFKTRRILKRYWDHYHMPLPFTKATVVFGEPITYPAKMNDDEMNKAVDQLNKVLTDITAKAESHVKNKD